MILTKKKKQTFPGANSSCARCSENGSCTSTCKNKHQNADNSRQNAAAANLPANVSPSYYREVGIALDDEEAKDFENENEAIDQNFRLMMGLEPENPYSDWSCEVNSDGEEVCTCRDYTDNDTSANSEDELSMSRKFIFMFFLASYGILCKRNIQIYLLGYLDAKRLDCVLVQCDDEGLIFGKLTFANILFKITVTFFGPNIHFR